MNFAGKKFGFVSSHENPEADCFFNLLNDAFPGNIEKTAEGSGKKFDGLLFFGEVDSPVESGIPSLVVIPSGKVTENVCVQFGSGGLVPRIFRGREVKQKRISVFDKTPVENKWSVVASCGGIPFWTAFSNDNILHYRCSAAPKQFSDAAHSLLFQQISSEGFAQFLPVMDFLRRIGEEPGWTAPPLRGHMMFDDPNLHSKSYGWLDYPKLIQSAQNHNYHASFATIPLDAWYTSAKSAELFRNHGKHLSLLVHGNNHLSQELLRFSSEQTAITEMGQAMNRTLRLEKKSGVEISKVVAAPHGACSEQTLGVLARLGYEAACISPGSLYSHNSQAVWTKRIGTALAEVIRGLPVIPRLRMSLDNTNAILLAAYFDQAIIPVGHHQEARDGLKMIEALASFINSLGPVQWLDMKDISRGNFHTKTAGDTLHVNTFSRHFNLAIPQGITNIRIERPCWTGKMTDGITIKSEGVPPVSIKTYNGESVPMKSGSRVEIISIHPDAIDTAPIKGGINLKAVARRHLCEIRDRLAPMMG